MYLKDRERQKIFHVLVHSPGGHNGQADLGQSQERGTPSRSRAQVHGPVFTVFPCALAGAGLEAEQLGLELALWFGMPASQVQFKTLHHNAGPERSA